MPITRVSFRRPSRSHEIAPYFTAYVRQQLSDWADEHEYDLETGGLQIYTMIDSQLQEAAQIAVREVTDDLQAVADVEWSQASPQFISTDASAYRNRRSSSVAFSYFWSTHEDVFPSFMEQSDRYKRS